jgi:hypothetical protein
MIKIVEKCQAFDKDSEELVEIDVQYEIEEHCIKEIRCINHPGFNGEVKEIIFPQSYMLDGKKEYITGIGSDVFRNRDAMKIDETSFHMGSSLFPVKKVVIPEGITNIEPRAFRNLYTYEIVWPSTCVTIPPGCFEWSRIHQFTGIENVEVIGESAFCTCCGIFGFDWPQKCKVIPMGCFKDCIFLRSIRGIKDVESIGAAAFSCTAFENFIWPEKCKKVPAYCFYESEHLVNVSFFSEVTSVGYYSFTKTQLKCLDLSKSLLCDIDKSVEDSVKLILRPYYQE